jgi:predicted Zn-dependent protease with MMP-like domain
MDRMYAKSPSLADIEMLADQAFARLPQTFRDRCKGLVIRVEEFPDEDVIREMELESPFDILGLYQGVSIAYEDAGGPPRLPDMVFLYRRPLLDYWAEYDETLPALVTHVLVHEIGHHFGLDDEDMQAIEDAASDA